MSVPAGMPVSIISVFLLLVVTLVSILIYGYNRVLLLRGDRRRKTRVAIAAVLIVSWLFFICYLSTLHILDQFSVLPPRMGIVVVPPLIAIILLVNNKNINRLLTHVSQQDLVWVQSFRIVTGLLFYFLYLSHVIPVHMTFLGKNFDLIFSLTAPLFGYLAMKSRLKPWMLTCWHLAGIGMLGVVVITAVLSAPFPFRIFQVNENNTMIAYFPFVMMPGFVIPVGILLHLLGLKKSLKAITELSGKLKDHRIRIIGIPLVALVMAAILHYQLRTFSPDFFFGFAITFGLTILLWHGDRLIITKMRLMYPEYHQTTRRVTGEFIITAIFTIATVIIIDSFLYIYVIHEPPEVNILLSDVSIGLVISFIMLTIYESIYFFSSWKQNILEVEHLKSVQFQKKLDMLKNQLNPHFLFNSLNSLTSLVETNSSQGPDFVQKLSDVYRYILQSNESELNSLGCEKKFIEKYLHILKVRYAGSLFFEISIPDKVHDSRLVQLSLQMLIDNAIRHNVISSGRPLHIRIFTGEGNYLIVSNNIQKKIQLLKTGNFGLSDLRKRYEAFGSWTIRTEQSENEFRVFLPLIPAEKHAA